MRATCETANKQCEIVVHPDTPRTFNADCRPDAAKDGCGRMLAWLRGNGVT